MATYSDSERRAVAAQIAEALSAGDMGVQGPGTAEAPAGDPKEIFCDNWGMVKMVLQILRQFAPAFLKPMIDIVIKGGDTLKGLICR